MTTLATEIEFYQACAIKGALKLQAEGMKHSRLSGAQLLASASKYTKHTYKRGQYTQAVADLQVWIDAQLAAKRNHNP